MPMGQQLPSEFVTQPAPTPIPELSYFSAGAPELPPTASAILGGASNQLPIGEERKLWIIK